MTAIALREAPLGVPLGVLEATLEPGTRRRLTALGWRSGALVSVVHATSGGGRVVSLGGARVGIGRDLLSELTVEVLA